MPFPPAIPWDEVAAVAQAAADAGLNPLDAICDQWGIDRDRASQLTYLARQRGFDVPRVIDNAPVVITPPGPWVDQAACRGLDTALFFPERGEPADTARRVCAECPVRQECLDYATANHERDGVWGGLLGHERRRLRTRQLRGAA